VKTMTFFAPGSYHDETGVSSVINEASFLGISILKPCYLRIAAALLILFSGAVSAEEAPLIVRLATMSLPNTPTIESLVSFKQRVESLSLGAIRVELYDSGKPYGDLETGPAVSSGAVEMGYVNLSRYAATIPAAGPFELPFVFNDARIESAARAPGSEIREIIEAAILAHAGARALWWVPAGPAVLFSKDFSVADVKNLNGRSVRINGPTFEAIVRACGGAPKDIPATEQARAYEQGGVDIGSTSISTYFGRGLYRWMKTVTRTNHAYVEFVVTINEAFWQSLTDSQRVLISEAARASDRQASDRVLEIEATIYKQLEKDFGVTVTTLTDDELIAWRICSSEVLTDFVERAGDAGQALMAAYGRLRSQPCCNLAAKRD
jgi:C4-dicarboxylate-binding protein DctP